MNIFVSSLFLDMHTEPLISHISFIKNNNNMPKWDGGSLLRIYTPEYEI